MTYNEVNQLLEKSGTEQNRKIYKNHGCDIPMYGVSMKILKEVYKKIKNDRELGLLLFRSNNLDMIYLSQWLVDMDMIEVSEILEMIDRSSYYIILENVLPSILVKDKDKASDFVRQYLHSSNHKERTVAYALYSQLISYYDLDLDKIKEEVDHIISTISIEENRVKYVMNQFLIAVGVYEKELSSYVYQKAQTLDPVKVDMGKTACKVPSILTYIEKNQKRDKIGLKKTLK